MVNVRQHYSLLPPVIRLLLISNIIIFLLEQIYADKLIAIFALWPIIPDQLSIQNPQIIEFMPWQLISYAFLHAGILHISLNMYALWFFGAALENLWGSRIFAIYYFVTVIGAGLVQLVVTTIGLEQGDYYPTIGASGGVFGVLLAFGLFFPNRVLILLIPPVPIKAKWFVLIFGGLELWFAVSGTEAGVANFAHLGGMFFGLILIYFWKRYSPDR